jgi:hypothetical protein
LLIYYLALAEKKYVQNYFRPINSQKYVGDVNDIVYRSSYELKAFHWCDRTPEILEWSSETIIIKYFDPTTNKIRRYFPDLYIKIRDKTGVVKRYIIEIKPKRQTEPPKPSARKKSKTYLNEMATYQKNLAKWTAAENFCKENGLEFIKITENELFL